jgi:hypothetical protein
MKFKITEDGEFQGDEIIAIVPSTIDLSERFEFLIEGKWEKLDNDHDVRLDNRPEAYGGRQLHIRNRNGMQWAYRDQGQRSERSKYRSAATSKVQDIVRDVFKLDSDVKIEWKIKSNDGKEVLLESLDLL